MIRVQPISLIPCHMKSYHIQLEPNLRFIKSVRLSRGEQLVGNLSLVIDSADRPKRPRDPGLRNLQGKYTSWLVRLSWQAILSNAVRHTPSSGMTGSFLLIHANVEQLVGWDMPCLVEDYWFSRKVSSPSSALQPGSMPAEVSNLSFV